MSFTIQSEYLNAVESFVWPTSTSSTLILSTSIVDKLVQDVYMQIKMTFEQSRTGLSHLANKEPTIKQFSKIEACYIAAQNTDAHSESTELNIAMQIQNAPQQVKDVLHHLKNKIAERDPRNELGNEEEIKTAVLLCGTQDVYKNLKEIIRSSNMCKLETKLAELAKLAANISSPVSSDAPESFLLQTFNTSILQMTEQLAKYKESTAASTTASLAVSSPAAPILTTDALSTSAKKDA